MSMVYLSTLTSMGVGGCAEVKRLTAREQIPELPLDSAIILGRGTNVLVSDRPLDRPVIISDLRGAIFDGEKVVADSGISLIRLCALSAERGLSGLEWACGIPGSLGGAIVGNAGAYGGCIADVITAVEVYRDRKFVWLNKSECGFSYRHSAIKTTDFVVRARLKLTYADYDAIRETVVGYRICRERSQPLGRSAGSVYKRADRAAGAYIEEAGLKGARVGGASVSEKHANFIINDGTATATDVYALMTKIETAVERQFGVKLQREIKLIGEF